MRQANQATIQYLFNALGADFYVNSIEGEQALVGILKALKDGSDITKIHNIWYKSGKKYISTAVSNEDNDLVDNPVNWGLFSKERIGEFVSLRTSKSCPFSCAFCGFPERAGKYHCISVDTLEREMNAIKEIGTITSLSFIDDTFNVPKKRF